MVRIFPVTKPGLEDRYLSDKIYGFAFNMPAYRMDHVTELMPGNGGLKIVREDAASGYDHDLEDVHPWRHRVLLEDDNITAEWTTTEHACVYRFHFASGDSCRIVFRGNRESCFEITDRNIIQGWEEFNGARQYFHLHCSRSFDNYSVFRDTAIYDDERVITGIQSGAFVLFQSVDEPLEVRIGISYISAAQARSNMEKETKDRAFEQITGESHGIWKEALEKIRVKGGTERQQRIFYTSLYRCYERMVNISEYGQYYSGYDGKVHDDEGIPFYVDDWLWDTYRSLHPLMLILDPARQADMVQSYVRMYEQGGWMPGFPQFYGDFPAMIGFHSAALVWDTYIKGVTGFDVEKAYEGLRKNALQATMLPWKTGRMCGIDSFYHKHGWYPAIDEHSPETEKSVDAFERRQSVSVTLEHSYDDWCLAQLAGALGRKEDYAFFMKRSQNYRNVFNPQTGFFSPRSANGHWIEPFDPRLSGGIGGRAYFTENNAWTWNFSVPHDIPGLIELLGGKELLVQKLDALFNEPTRIAKWQFMGLFPDATGLNGQFVAGNEPSMHIPYLYNYAGQPWKTQRRIRELMDLWFDDRPLGIPGDEDGGGLCSWYVFSAMGFFPVTVGSGEYALGSPFFEEITISLPGGKKFTIKARNCSERNKYIQSASLNGEPLKKPFLSHQSLIAGGMLVLEMGEKPDREWFIP
jgi:predicted alpha-1,2-mannosidase